MPTAPCSGWLPAPASHCLSALLFAEEEQGAAPGGGPGSTSAESPGGGRDPSQPLEPEGPTGAPAGDTEPPEGFPRPPSPVAPTQRPDRPRDALGRPAHAASPGAPGHRTTSPTSAASATSTESREPGGTPRRGHKSGGASTPLPAAEDAELSGDVVESPGASPLPPAPSQTQEEGEEQSGAVWLPSPAVPGDGSTVPAVTPWHAELPGSSSAPALGGEEAAPRPPGADRGMPAAASEEEEEEEEQPAPSIATVEGFLAAVPGEPGGTLRDGLTSPRTDSSGVVLAGTPLGDPAPSTAVPLPALPTERASVGAGACSARGPCRATLALGAALLAALWH